MGEGGLERAQCGGKKTGPRVWAACAERKEGRAGLVSGLGWIAKGFGFPFSFLFLSPFSISKHHSTI